MPKTDALLTAGPTRLRPILMTAMSTIAGMLPVAMGLGEGSASRAPMGACVVGGMITSTVLTRWVVTLMDRFFEKVPGAKIIYSAIKDLMEALVGEKKKFDRPVAVRIMEGGPEAIGFITRENLPWADDPGKIAVYFPQSYNFAGQVLLFPKDRVRALEAEPAEVMKFVVSGGVS